MRYLILLLLITGCYTAKKAEQQTNKALLNYPVVVAKVARDAFPCITKASDTVTRIEYEYIDVDCPDSIIKTELIPGDTVIRITTKTVRVQVPAKTIYITKNIEDSAKIKLLVFNIEAKDKVILNQYNQIVKKDKKITAKNKELWIYRSLLLLLVLYLCFRLYKSLTTIKFSMK
jgi:hypothetical protein